MSKKSLMITLGGVGAALLAVGIVATAISNQQAYNLDLLFRPTLVKEEGEVDNYIEYKCTSQEEALANAQDVTRKTAEEGYTLLKNEGNALPIAKDTKLNIFGYYAWHNNMSGGEDPASQDVTSRGGQSLAVGLQEMFTNYNQAVTAKYAATNGDFADPDATFADVENTFGANDVAVVVLKRNSGEGNDQAVDKGAGEFNRTGLSITNAEIKLIDYVNRKFNKVVIIVNSANTMELGFLDENDPHRSGDNWKDPYSDVLMKVNNIKAAIWVGPCGSQGGKALANVMSGDVTPSGHLSDIYVRTLRNDPSYVNFGSFKYTDIGAKDSYGNATYFVEYEEGIYNGYRFYETAEAEHLKGNYADFDYDESVVFPFGYGLSYTTFSKEFVGMPAYNQGSGEFTFTVKVTNTGAVKGKEVAQIYVNVPYSAGQVEKPHVVLGGFAKTKVLNPGDSEELEITVNRDYFTSYDYLNEKAYLLDAGDYKFYLAENSHDWERIDGLAAGEQAKRLYTWNLASKMVFKDGQAGKRATDLKVATNVEDDETNFKVKPWSSGLAAGDGFVHTMTRSNFAASFPTAPTGNDYKIKNNEKAMRYINVYDVSDPANNPITEKPEINTDKTNYTLQEMRGVDFNDRKWDDFMNQFSADKMAEMFMNGGWQEVADVENGVPISYDCDSPYGFYGFSLSIKTVNKWYCGAPLVSATYNVELAKELGYAFAEEAHANSLAGGTLITGLYGYGLNGHRSAFGGRNYEYYSEDPVLAGKMAAFEAGACSEKGMICFMKHFALNEQETHRQDNGYCVWADEQTLREVYFRGWEIYIKEAKMEINYKDNGVMRTKTMPGATGIMTAYNRIGSTYAGASVSLVQILREEFGYTGSTITDAGGNRDTYMTNDFLLRRGGNLTLANNGTDGLYDKTSNTALYWLKDATKHTLYNKANSNCVDGLGAFHYTTAPWRTFRTGAWIVLGSVVGIDVVVILLIGFNVIKIKPKAKKESTGGDEEF